MEVILTIAYAALFFYLIRKSRFYKTAGVAAWIPPVIFLLKCFSGVLLGLLYTYYYTNHSDADSFKFFTDSKIMFDTLFSRPHDFIRMFTGVFSEAPELRPYYVQMDSWLNTNTLFNDNKTIIRMNAFFRFFSLGHYYVHVIFLNFISFTGLFCLYKTFIIFCPGKKKVLFYLTFLIPSVLFWGSGLLKDGLLLSGFGLVVYSFTLLLKKGFSKKRILFFLLGITILLFTKIYVIVVILPGLVAWWLTYNSSKWKMVASFIGIYLIYLILAFNLYRVAPDYNVAALLFYKQKNFIEFGHKHNATMISLPPFECSAISILKNSPAAFSITLTRPFLTDVHGNPMILLSALENLLILLMIFLCIVSFNLKEKSINSFVLFCSVLIILLFILIGLITPVLGAIVRYRIVALPCLAFVLTYYFDHETLLSRLPFLRRKGKSGAA